MDCVECTQIISKRKELEQVATKHDAQNEKVA